MRSRASKHEHAAPVDKAVRKLKIAARRRQLAQDPAAVALSVQRVTAAVNWLMWSGILLGIAFSTVNVQRFAAGGTKPESLQWWAAWLFEPFINLVLIAILLGQICARHNITVPGTWPTATKWFCFLATLGMNTWSYWMPFDLAGVILHVIPPGIVLCAAETAPVLNTALARAVTAAETATTAATNNDHVTPGDNSGTRRDSEPSGRPNGASTPSLTDLPRHPVDSAQAGSADSTKAAEVPQTAPTPQEAPKKQRRSRQEIVNQALQHWRPGVPVDRQFILTTTGCASGIASDVAMQVNAAIEERNRHRNDEHHDELQEDVGHIGESNHSDAHQPRRPRSAVKPHNSLSRSAGDRLKHRDVPTGTAPDRGAAPPRSGGPLHIEDGKPDGQRGVHPRPG